jgi:hypothetical protein
MPSSLNAAWDSKYIKKAFNDKGKSWNHPHCGGLCGWIITTPRFCVISWLLGKTPNLVGGDAPKVETTLLCHPKEEGQGFFS